MTAPPVDLGTDPDQSVSDAPHGPDPGGPELDDLLERALEEDVGAGDVTTEAVVQPGTRGQARLVAKAAGVLSGLQVFERVFTLLDPDVRFRSRLQEAATVQPGVVVLELEGPLNALLIGERTALNFVQRLSGIATLTRRFVEAGQGAVRILDTRKTTPGLRVLEKYAVRCGGGENHRFGLYDEAMLKDNHRDASDASLSELVQRLRMQHPRLRITAEARDTDEALEAVEAGVDVVLLDNFAADQLHRLVPLLRAASQERGRPLEIEASGGVTLETMPALALTGVDRVSVGALTHSAPALDLSLELEPCS